MWPCAVRQVAETLLPSTKTRFLLLSANVINSYQLPFVHHRIGAWPGGSTFEYYGTSFRSCSSHLSQHRTFLERMSAAQRNVSLDKGGFLCSICVCW